MEENSMQSASTAAAAPPAETFQPLIIALCCNWCSYAGADLAGVSRIQYPPSIRVIRVMCSGMVHPNLVIEALTKGADGVLMCGATLATAIIRTATKKRNKGRSPYA
jgi:coenzyme F420-reducing hydrogenase delta subunit